MVKNVIYAYQPQRVHELGFDLFEYCKNADIDLMPYSQLPKHMVDILLEKLEDGCSFINFKTNRFVICYNDMVKPKERIKYTIAHELGHLYCDHCTKRRYLTKDEKEKEADYFAQIFYTPQYILFKYNITSIKDIRKKLGISGEFARKAASKLEIRIKLENWSEEEIELFEVIENNIKEFEEKGK